MHYNTKSKVLINVGLSQIADSKLVVIEGFERL